MRKLLLTFLFFFLIFSSGCNKSDNNIKTISFSTWGSQSEIATIQSLISEFEKANPDIKIKLIHIPDNYFQKLHLLIASNLSPDVIFVNNLNSKIYVDAEKFEDLTGYLANGNMKKEHFLDNALVPLSDNGKIFAIPRDISNIVIYYNKDLFDKYNIPYPNSNWTMEEFLSVAKKLSKDTDNDGKLDIFGFGFETKSLYWLPFLLSNGGGILSVNSDEIILNDKNSLEALQFYSDLRNKYHVSPKIDEQASVTTSQMFMQGKVAMHLCGRWCSLTYKKNKDLRWDIVGFPKGRKGSIVTMDASGWAISTSSKYKNESWKFIEFMASDKAMNFMAKDGLIIPSAKNVAYSNIFLNPPPEHSKIFLDVMDNSVPTPTCPKYAEINDILNEKLEILFNGKSDVNGIINTDMISKIKELISTKDK